MFDEGQEEGRSEIKILIVDDHPILREGLRMLIENHGHLRVVAEAGTREQALSAAQKHLPDIVLLDLDLGGESGLDLIQELNGIDERIKILVFTGVRDSEMQRQAVRLGALGVVMKDRAAQVLIRAIEKVHEGELWVDHLTLRHLVTEMRRKDEALKADPELEKIQELTAREREIACLVAQGLSTNDLAERLFITEKTVRNHLASIYAKLDVSDRLELALFAMRHLVPKAPQRNV